MSEEKGDTKLAKLMNYLGDLADYRDTGWYSYDGVEWSCRWKENGRPYTKEEIDIMDKPDYQSHCHCSTKISKNCLLINIKTHKTEIVGSDCIELFGGHRKHCRGCDKLYRGNYAKCKACRDKEEREKQEELREKQLKKQQELRERQNQIRKQQEERESAIIPFGRYRYMNVDELVGGNDD